jgi:hypothetical protein
MRFLLLLFALPLLAEETKTEPPKEPTIEELKADLAKTKTENENLTKLLSGAWSKYQACETQAFTMSVLDQKPKR